MRPLDSLCARRRRRRSNRNDFATLEHNGGAGGHVTGATLQTCYNHLLHRCHELLETATRGAVYIDHVDVHEREMRLSDRLALTRKSQGQRKKEQARTPRASQLSCSNGR